MPGIETELIGLFRIDFWPSFIKRDTKRFSNWFWIVRKLIPEWLWINVSRFDTRTLRTQRQQQYVRENGCVHSVVCLLFAVVLWVISGFLSLTSSLQPEKTQRTTANSRRKTQRAQPFSRTYCCWRYVRKVRVSNLDTLLWIALICLDWIPIRNYLLPRIRKKWKIKSLRMFSMNVDKKRVKEPSNTSFSESRIISG